MLGVLFSGPLLGPPTQPAAALGQLAPGEFYTQADLESQLDAIRDMLRHGAATADVVDDLKLRFLPLKEADFEESMSEQRKADLGAMISLAGFLANGPAPKTTGSLNLPSALGREGATRTSGLVNEIVEDVLQRMDEAN